MTFRIAQMAGGLVSKIFRETEETVDLGDRVIAFRHVKTWVTQGDPMATRYSLVAITTPAQPVYNSRTHMVARIEPQVGGASTQDAWQIVARDAAAVRAELINDIKDRAWELWGRASWAMTRTAWLDYRDNLKTRGLALVAAHDAGNAVDVQMGSIDGKGAWPVA